MSDVLCCWRCGETIVREDLPITRQSRCRHCGADLYVCRQCRFYNPRLSRKCEEDRAEPARAVDVANFCDWFEAVSPATNGKRADADEAARRLAALFGEETGTGTADTVDDPAAKMAALLQDAEKKQD